MNWEAIGAVGEVIGAIAVVATLGYLIIQIRQNTRELQHSSSWAINQGLNQINQNIIENPDQIETFHRALGGLEDLTNTEFEICRAHFMGLLNLAIYYHGVKKTQNVEAAHIDPIKIVGGMYVKYPGFRKVINASANQLPDPELMDIFKTSSPMEFGEEMLAQISDKSDSEE